MKILPINSNYNYNANKTKKNEENKVITPQNNTYSSKPLYFNPAYCINFCGACVDLSKAVKKLKATEIIKEDNRIPSRVEDLANIIIRKGNLQELTLIDIHKQSYFNVMCAKSIEEIREKFPEFKGVLSVYELETPPQQGSFLREVLDGKNKYFSKDDDISLQLMKMYWGEGFSLSDLEKHTGIKSTIFTSIMKILNIPLKNKHYASVLKHSDPDASKRIVDMISATKDANFEKANGYISIPKGLLPVEMSQKILDSLFEYYEKDPIRIYEQPKIVKKFYKDNILAQETFRATMLEVWNFSSMKNVKRNMLNFFNRKNALQQNGKNHKNYVMRDINGYDQLSSIEIEWMKNYFANNKKDKEALSRSLKSAYKHIKQRIEAEKTKKTDIVLYPKKFQEIVHKYYEQIGRDQSEFIPNLLKLNDTKSYSTPICGRISINEILKNDIQADIAYTRSLYETFHFAYDLIEYEKSPVCKEVKKLLTAVFNSHNLFGIDSNTAMNVYINLCNTLAKGKREDLVLAISRYLEKSAKFTSEL